MRHIMISPTVRGVDIICRHCGNAESSTTPYLKRFRLEGTGKDSAMLRCLTCQTAVSTPMSKLSALFYHHAC
ncbi:hypothetical protein M0220_02335 [Halomonas qinghailakensis]|uniref:Uncharacterized protein n=1 Tax=Halomonas qinghailakensis TaxID=2937790 RepID=A0AA46TR84_9GAMM|nr:MULTISPECIES: hypothetical protein [Halomonas]UYO75019.1 hypothetical protein M0220_02335 [Halomonas sp. ZZQ-149]